MKDIVFHGRVATKTCTACGGTFSARNFDGDVCKACAARAAAESKPKKKCCSSCGRMLPYEDFPVNPLMRTGRGARCKECVSRANKEAKARARARKAAEQTEAPAPSLPAKPAPTSVAASVPKVKPRGALIRRNLPADLPDLLPCPFCGHGAKLVPVFVGSAPAVWNIECKCTTGWNASIDTDDDGAELSHAIDFGFETPEQAARFWNRRPKIDGAKRAGKTKGAE